MQLFVLVVTGITTFDKFKLTRAGTSLNFSAGMSGNFILGAQKFGFRTHTKPDDKAILFCKVPWFLVLHETPCHSAFDLVSLNS